ncbi:hypothetical protein P9J64_13540 [Deltaproteobacteria bacterium IMCC39524]|nr:hypothetical protein [Deltaproteobacteria bacterium IMCC39524]
MSDKQQTPQPLNIVNKDERTICNGAVVLFKRNRSKRWQARIRRNSGEWVVYSTKCADFEKAIAVAEERYREIQYAQKTGKIDVTRRFSSICQLCRKELLDEAERTSQQTPKNYVQVIDKYIQPILGSYMCHNIDTAALRMYSDKRKEMIGHAPTQSTIATHNSALKYLFRKAQEKNFIKFIPKTINDGVKGKRRPYFNNKEMKKLNANMWRYIQHSEKLLHQKGRNGIENISQKTYWIRELLVDVVRILVNTGMRPGSEILSLKWKNLSITKQHDKESIQFSLPHSKTIKRVVIGYEPHVREDGVKYGCWKPLENIKNRFDNLKDLDWDKLFECDEYIFRYPNGELVVQERLTKAFKRMLKWIKVDGKEDGLLKDDFGDDRTLYSLRHTYASRMRYKDISFDDLSVQMGTQVNMLEKHYSHFTVSDNPNKFAGHERRAEKDKQKAAQDNNQIIQQLLEQNAKKDGQIQQLLEQLLNKENDN